MTRKTAALLLLLALPLPAAAQGRPPAPAASLGLSSAYASPDGLMTRRAGLTGEAGLGEAAGLKLRLSAAAEHLRGLGGTPFPGELYKTDLRLTAEDRRHRLVLALGSNSDRPYHSPSETDLGFTFSRTFSEKGPRAWLWGLNYSSRRSFLRGLPFPFVGYRYVTESLTIVAPFMARWQASKKVSFSASLQPPKYFRLAAVWRPLPFVSAELEGGTALEQFLPAGRPDKDEAFYYETSYVALKPSIHLSRSLQLTPSLGWQLKSSHYTGSSYDDHRGRTSLPGGPSLGLAVKYDF
ncbi:MAG: hypothetical protein ACYC2I_01730 [Elusimicrobiales bacterium]